MIPPSPDECQRVAQWMLDELRRRAPMYQEDVVTKIEREFGKAFVYENERGNVAISKAVLKAFREASGPDVVWESGERAWRFRQPGDAKGRQQT